MDLRNVELFRTGRWNDLKTFTRDDLDAMVDSFAALRLAGRVPLKAGHNAEQPLTDGQPALGWVDRIWRDGDVLKADFSDLPRAVYDAIKNGLYKFVSVELLRDVAASDREYSWVLSAVALLGADLPAVAGLADLQRLTMARCATFPNGTRMTFSIGGQPTMTTDNAALQAENRRLNRELVQRVFADAIREGRILPRDEYAFTSRMGESATLEEAKKWIAGTPRPPAMNRQQPSGGTGHDNRGDDALTDGDPPDVAVMKLTRAEMKADSALTYFAAQLQVLRANPELAERYRHQPGVKD